MFEKTYYAKPFLREVISRVDFVAPVESLAHSLPRKLAKELSEHFPIGEPTVAIAQQLQVTGTGVTQHKEQFKEWNFYGKDREKRLALTRNCIFITHSRYRTYEDMRDQFGAATAALSRAFPDVGARRFGLRYINVIELQGLPSPTSWDAFIAEELLGTTAFFTEPANLTRSIHIAELKYGDIEVRFQFGMPNPDHPAPIKRPQFVLDLDAYVQTAHDFQESLRYMEEAHGRLQELFERSITDELRGRMDAKKRVTVQE